MLCVCMFFPQEPNRLSQMSFDKCKRNKIIKQLRLNIYTLSIWSASDVFEFCEILSDIQSTPNDWFQGISRRPPVCPWDCRHFWVYSINLIVYKICCNVIVKNVKRANTAWGILSTGGQMNKHVFLLQELGEDSGRGRMDGMHYILSPFLDLIQWHN